MSQSSSHGAPCRFRGRSRALGITLLAAPAALAAGAALGLPSAFATGSPTAPVSVRFAAGQTPAPAHGKPSASPAPAPGPDERALEAYFAKGYDYDDAVTLAKIWRQGEISSVKVTAGRKLLAGQQLPVRPHPPQSVPVPEEERAVSAFFAKGYDYDDAVTLAKIWHTDSPYSAKIKAGHKLLAGQQLPA